MPDNWKDEMPDTPSRVAIATLVSLLENGDNTPKNIAEITGSHRTSVQRTLRELDEEGLVENKGSGVYTLTKPGFVAARTYWGERS